MRFAEIGKLREDLQKRHHEASPTIDALEFESLPGFSDSKIYPKRGFLVVCGGTGVGKTTLLELFYCTLRGEDDPDPRGIERVSRATARISISFPREVNESYHGTFSADKKNVAVPKGVRFVAIESRTADIQRYLSINEFAILKEGSGAIKFDDDLVDLVSLVCSKKYSSINVYESEIEDKIVPIFEIESDDINYDSRSMATGELSVFYLAWALYTAEPYSIVIIEEPESHLPPHSHFAVFGLMARYSLKRKLCLIISTHSPTIASEVPDHSLISIRRQGKNAILPIGMEPKTKVLSRLGLQPRKHVILFVEDKLAKDVLVELIADHGLETVCRLEVFICQGGAGEIKNRLEHIPSKLNSFSCAGILDGDMREKAAKWKLPNPIVFLPFNEEMEVEFLAAAEAAVSGFARRLGRNRSKVEDAFTETRGQNFHDRYKNISVALGFDEAAFTNHALKHWVSTLGKSRAVGKFVREISRSLALQSP